MCIVMLLNSCIAGRFVMAEEILNGIYTMGLDTTTIIVICAFAAVMLLLAILAIVALFRQKAALAKINDTLMRMAAPAAPAAPAYMPPPAPNACPKCGAPYSPDSAFCQNCGSAL